MNTLEFLYQLLNLKQPLNQVLLGLSVGGHFYKVKWDTNLKKSKMD